MRRYNSLMHFANASAVLAAIAAAGCTPESRSTIERPKVDPTVAADRALELYDRDSDGALDETELAACPGILAARERYDFDTNGQISREELVAHLTAIFSSGGLTNLPCHVLAAGRPLADAQVRFLPEPFLEDALLPASGTTDSAGLAMIAIEAGLPADQLALRALQPGIYRVEIEHPSVRSPHKPLGYEVDPGARGATDPVFNL